MRRRRQATVQSGKDAPKMARSHLDEKGDGVAPERAFPRAFVSQWFFSASVGTAVAEPEAPFPPWSQGGLRIAAQKRAKASLEKTPEAARKRVAAAALDRAVGVYLESRHVQWKG